MVLRHTQVRLRGDGDVLENDRITFRISPDLERHERYTYLLSRLAPKPRKAQPGAAEREGAGVTPAAGVTSAAPPTILKQGSDVSPMEGVTDVSPMEGV